MSDQVRVGMAGTSWWADMMHLPTLKSHPQANIVAICGRNRERAEEMAKKYEIPTVFTDYREMIEKGGLDAVVIATPDDTHYPITMKALEAGLHVVCEKPMALNLKQAQEMYEKAEAVGVKHMIFFTGRWFPHFQYAKKLIDDGYIGQCLHCQMHIFARYDGREGWRFDPQRALGIIGDFGSHIIDRARWLVGDIARVSASIATFADETWMGSKDKTYANDSAILTIEFVNGAQGIIHVSAVAHAGNRGQQFFCVLHGKSGTLEIDSSFTKHEVRGLKADEQEFQTLFVPERFESEWMRVFTWQSVGNRLFIDSILKDKPIQPNFYDGLKTQEVIEAAFESQNTGCKISIK